MAKQSALFADETFGGKVYAHRIRLGLPQADVAARARISPAYFSGIENSKRPAPPPKTVWRIARALDLGPRDTQILCVLAEGERAVAVHEAELAPEIKDLLALIRACGPSMGSSLVTRIQDTIKEACM